MIKKTAALCFALFLFVPRLAFADFEAENWQFYKELVPEKEGFALIRLDKEVLRHSRNDLKDLRLVSAQGGEVPYKIIERKPAIIETYPVRIIDQVVRENEFSAVTLDLSEQGRLHNRVILELSSENDYLRDVYIEGGNDNRTWHSIDKAKLFRVGSSGQDTVNYSPVSYRYIRVKIDCQGKEPLNIAGARVKFIPKRNDDFRILPVEIISDGQDRKTNTSEVIVDLGVKGIYINSISLQVNSGNFDRPVQISHSYDQKEWQIAGSGRIFNYSWTDYTASEDSLTINERLGRYIKIQIQNGDSPPLTIKGVEVKGRYPALLADLNQEKYRLWYGNPGGKIVQYDLNRFAHLINTDDLPEVKTAGEEVNKKHVSQDKLLESRTLLNIITVVAVIVIGFIILRNLNSKKQ